MWESYVPLTNTTATAHAHATLKCTNTASFPVICPVSSDGGFCELNSLYLDFYKHNSWPLLLSSSVVPTSHFRKLEVKIGIIRKRTVFAPIRFIADADETELPHSSPL